MKIAMLTNNYRPFVGGVPVSVERQAVELVRLGHEVTVFAPMYGDSAEEQAQVLAADERAPERVIRYGTQKRKMANGMVYPSIYPAEILRTFQTEPFDCIHVHHPMFVGPCALLLGKKYQVPVIYTCHTRYEDYLHYIPGLQVRSESPAVKHHVVRWLRETGIPAYIKWFANQCDLVLAPSAGMKSVIQGYGVRSRCEVFPTGLAGKAYCREEGVSARIRKQYGHGKRHLLVTVSRLEREKNYGFLLRGIEELRRLLGDEFHVMIIGSGSQEAELKTKAAVLRISDLVTFVGNVPNSRVKDYLGAADLFLFASTSETQGIVLAEAMAAGLPVAAVHAVGSDDIVRDGWNGYLTEEKEEQWAQKAARILTGENCRRMKAAALQTAENYRSSTLALYEEMLYNQCICEKRVRDWRGCRGRMALQEEIGKGENVYESQTDGREHSAVVLH